MAFCMQGIMFKFVHLLTLKRLGSVHDKKSDFEWTFRYWISKKGGTGKERLNNEQQFLKTSNG